MDLKSWIVTQPGWDATGYVESVNDSAHLATTILWAGPRTGFLDALREMGADVEVSNLREEAAEPVGDVKASYAPLRALRLPAGRAPALIDEIPLLSVLAAAASGESVLEGLLQ